jgi:CheY-like chemotaxis protein
VPPRSYAEPLRILVVDGHLALLEYLAEVLRQDGHAVSAASSALTALAQLQAGEWDIVLTDKEPPDMAGVDFAQQAKLLSDVPVVMMTGAPPAAPLPGVDAVLIKPFPLASLAETISKCLADGNGAETPNELHE